jgi:DNA mismatch repair protein MutH
MRLVGPEGEAIDTVPRGFYLRPSFTKALFARGSGDR